MEHPHLFNNPGDFKRVKHCFIYCGDDHCDCGVKERSKPRMGVTVYTRAEPPCVWCSRVKELLADHNIGFTEVVLTREIWMQLLVKWQHNVQTVPQVEVNGVRIGGYEETKKWVEGSKL